MIVELNEEQLEQMIARNTEHFITTFVEVIHTDSCPTYLEADLDACNCQPRLLVETNIDNMVIH